MITLENIPLPASPALAPEGHYPLSLHMARGEILWVCGPAQSGKTALLERLALLVRPGSGRMSIMNYDTGPTISTRTRSLLRQRISLIEAAPVFMERLSLADNIALPLELMHFRSGDISREVAAIIRWFELEDVAEAIPASLSHTTRLRAACARALITQPSVILVDEPALTLCPALREQLLVTIRGLVRNGATALLAVQRPPDDAAQSDRHLSLPCTPATPSAASSIFADRAVESWPEAATAQAPATAAPASAAIPPQMPPATQAVPPTTDTPDQPPPASPSTQADSRQIQTGQTSPVETNDKEPGQKGAQP